MRKNNVKKVLIVDDEKWVRVALKWTLERSGLPLIVSGECGNGLEALDWLKSNTVDLVLADITMPVMNGLDFLRELRQQGSELDVIIITVNEEFSYVQEALRAGTVDYLLKPVEQEQLTLCLTKWLTKRKQAENKPINKIAETETNEFLSPVENVLKYLDSLPPGRITLADAAQHVHMNPSYLSQLFKQQQGINFIDYVIELRMKEAKRLLTVTSLRVSEIAERLGYNDLAYFTNMFKKTVGMTPSAYRKTYQNTAR